MESVRRTKQELMERIGLVQAQIEESTAQVRNEERERRRGSTGYGKEEGEKNSKMCTRE